MMVEEVIEEIQCYTATDHPELSDFRRLLLRLTRHQTVAESFADRYDNACNTYAVLARQFSRNEPEECVAHTKHQLIVAIRRLVMACNNGEQVQCDMAM